jgi:hypothetical protein
MLIPQKMAAILLQKKPDRNSFHCTSRVIVQELSKIPRHFAPQSLDGHRGRNDNLIAKSWTIAYWPGHHQK